MQGVFMKNTKNRIFGLITFIVGVMLVFSLIGCDTGNGAGNGNGNGNGDGGGNSGWPNSGILSEYGLSGMSAPAGAANITYGIATVGGHSLTIYFTGSPANDGPITSWFTSNSWAQGGTAGDGVSIITYMYSKAGFVQASYTRQSTTCQIQVVKD
jgi:hypothetical protein